MKTTMKHKNEKPKIIQQSLDNENQLSTPMKQENETKQWKRKLKHRNDTQQWKTAIVLQWKNNESQEWKTTIVQQSYNNRTAKKNN